MPDPVEHMDEFWLEDPVDDCTIDLNSDSVKDVVATVAELPPSEELKNITTKGVED